MTVQEFSFGNLGEPTEEKCPRCGGQVIYNGNYYCEFWYYGNNRPEGACDWALPHPVTNYTDAMIEWRLSGSWGNGFSDTEFDMIKREPTEEDFK